MKHQKITALWVGETLPLLAQLCIKSFLDHGHEFQLFACRLFAGCRVYFFDNNYGKISGVFRQTFRRHPGIALFPHGRLMQMFPELKALA